MRKALCVGINYYEHGSCLSGAVRDASGIANILEKNYDGTDNFKVDRMFAAKAEGAITKSALRKAVEELFSGSPKIALFYFAGHGTHDRFSGFLCTSDCHPGEPDEGLSLEYIMNVVKASKAENKIIILDSCHSGYAGNYANMVSSATLPENTTILAACKKDQYADERFGRGIFTTLLFDALNGGAMNILGEISPANIYAYIDKSLSPWDQRPVFKANIQESVCIRREKPPIDRIDLRKIIDYFYSADMNYPLSPAYEEDKRDVEDKTHYPEKEEIFRVLRKYNQLNLLVPVGEEYMYWAAVRSKSCVLTPLGKHYWNLATRKLI